MANTTKKITKKEFFATLLTKYPFTTEEKEFINHEIELLENKSNRKPTAEQKANEKTKAEILECMKPTQLYSITEMIKEFPCCQQLTNQKVNALIKQLLEAKLVERIEDKRKAYFRKVVGV